MSMIVTEELLQLEQLEKCREKLELGQRTGE